jgi:hypothetical protein
MAMGTNLQRQLQNSFELRIFSCTDCIPYSHTDGNILVSYKVLFTEYCLIVQVVTIDFACGKGNTNFFLADDMFKRKLTSNATVLDSYLTFVNILINLISRYQLPLNRQKREIIFYSFIVFRAGYRIGILRFADISVVEIWQM